MFKGIKNNINDVKKTSTNVFSTISKMITEIPKLPWKKLPLSGWLYLILGTVAFLAIIFIILPMVW